MDMSILFDTVYRNMHYQLERHNIQKGNIEQASAPTSMDVPLAIMRHNEAYKKFKCEYFSKNTQTGQTEQGEGGSILTGTNGPTTSESEAIYISDSDDERGDEEEDIQLIELTLNYV